MGRHHIGGERLELPHQRRHPPLREPRDHRREPHQVGEPDRALVGGLPVGVLVVVEQLPQRGGEVPPPRVHQHRLELVGDREHRLHDLGALGVGEPFRPQRLVGALGAL